MKTNCIAGVGVAGFRIRLQEDRGGDFVVLMVLLLSRPGTIDGYSLISQNALASAKTENS